MLATAGTVRSAYTLRDDTITEIREERREDLERYVTREEFLRWQVVESEKRDRQFFTLLDELRTIKR